MNEMKVVSITQTCSACPSQWEGKLEDGRMIYIRYQYGGLTIRVSVLPTDDVGEAVMGDYIFKKQIGEELDGFIGLNSIIDIIEKEHNLIFSTKKRFKDDPLTEYEMTHILENMEEAEKS